MRRLAIPVAALAVVAGPTALCLAPRPVKVLLLSLAVGVALLFLLAGQVRRRERAAFNRAHADDALRALPVAAPELYLRSVERTGLGGRPA